MCLPCCAHEFSPFVPPLRTTASPRPRPIAWCSASATRLRRGWTLWRASRSGNEDVALLNFFSSTSDRLFDCARSSELLSGACRFRPSRPISPAQPVPRLTTQIFLLFFAGPPTVLLPALLSSVLQPMPGQKAIILVGGSSKGGRAAVGSYYPPNPPPAALTRWRRRHCSAQALGFDRCRSICPNRCSRSAASRC